MAGPYCPEGDGGNSTVTNQDEAVILAATVAAVPVQGTALGTEDDSHLQGQYKVMAGDVAGS
jgi:hypothetical protein